MKTEKKIPERSRSVLGRFYCIKYCICVRMKYVFALSRKINGQNDLASHGVPLLDLKECPLCAHGIIGPALKNPTLRED